MKITKIHQTGENKFVKQLLQKSLTNDFLFDRYGFYVTVTEGNHIDFLYRKMWEDLFLRRDNYDDNGTFYENGVMILFISLNEAIGLINKLTPPILRKHIPEALKSMDSIQEVLEELLLDSIPHQPHQNKSEFKKFVGFNVFETNNSYDINRMDLIRSVVNDLIAIDIEMHSAPSIEDIYKGESITEYEIQLMININFSTTMFDEITDLYNDLFYEGDFKVLNVFKHPKYGCFFEVYSKTYSCSKNHRLKNFINRTYSKIMK